MAAVDIGAKDVPPVPVDDLDNLFNYEVENDLFQDVDTNMDIAPRRPTNPRNRREPLDAGLGLDEEIKVIKKRAPVAKLDEGRLLSQAGIPKLRRTAKERLRFKGKGHEYSDVAKLLNFYQLWLDDLYPRAKFADGLAIIEKLGHRKQIQTMRREWIDEGKARHSPRVEESEQIKSKDDQAADQAQRAAQTRRETERPQSPATRPNVDSPAAGHEIRREKPLPEDVLLNDSLFISDDENGRHDPPEDDLDALVAEDEALQQASTTIEHNEDGSTRPRRDSFDDEEEAMAGMGDLW